MEVPLGREERELGSRLRLVPLAGGSKHMPPLGWQGRQGLHNKLAEAVNKSPSLSLGVLIVKARNTGPGM